jgi:hypothetical protein
MAAVLPTGRRCDFPQSATYENGKGKLNHGMRVVCLTDQAMRRRLAEMREESEE